MDTDPQLRISAMLEIIHQHYFFHWEPDLHHFLTRQDSVFGSGVPDLRTGAVTTFTHVIVPIHVFPSNEKKIKLFCSQELTTEQLMHKLNSEMIKSPWSFIITGLVYEAALPLFGGHLQLASDEDLTKEDVALKLFFRTWLSSKAAHRVSGVPLEEEYFELQPEWVILVSGLEPRVESSLFGINEAPVGDQAQVQQVDDGVWSSGSPMVFNEVVSWKWSWIRRQSGHAIVNEDLSLSWVWTGVKCPEVQEVSKVEDRGGLLIEPVIWKEKWGVSPQTLSNKQHRWTPNVLVISCRANVWCWVGVEVVRSCWGPLLTGRDPDC